MSMRPKKKKSRQVGPRILPRLIFQATSGVFPIFHVQAKDGGIDFRIDNTNPIIWRAKPILLSGELNQTVLDGAMQVDPLYWFDVSNCNNSWSHNIQSRKNHGVTKV